MWFSDLNTKDGWVFMNFRLKTQFFKINGYSSFSSNMGMTNAPQENI
jgi:hypothetical protein